MDRYTHRWNKDRYSSSSSNVRAKSSPRYRRIAQHYREGEDPSYGGEDYYVTELADTASDQSESDDVSTVQAPGYLVDTKDTRAERDVRLTYVRDEVPNALKSKTRESREFTGEDPSSERISKNKTPPNSETISGPMSKPNGWDDPLITDKDRSISISSIGNCKPVSVRREPDDADPDKTSLQLIERPRAGLIPCRDVENYKCLNKISEGTYGTVYRAMNRETGEIVALKHIKYHEPHWKEGFPITYLREISILLELNHPNILQVKEIVTNEKRNQYYMVMEYIEHELKTLLEDKRPDFTLSERKCLLKQLLEGTRYMHDNWVMHRDLKTTNILYNNKGVLKICDFGMARKFGTPLKNYTYNVVTHWYRSPELFLGELKYSEKADMWSVGCIFAELILGRPLFMGVNDNDTLDKIFKLCGSPNSQNWPNFNKMPAVINNKFTFNNYKPNFHNLFKTNVINDIVNCNCYMSNAGLDLLIKMLTLDPEQRISAKDALNHPYLTEEKPRVQAVELMPTIPDTNCKVRDKRTKEDYEEGVQTSRFSGRVDPARFLSMMKKTKTSAHKY